jgi:hypothetical protein
MQTAGFVRLVAYPFVLLDELAGENYHGDSQFVKQKATIRQREHAFRYEPPPFKPPIALGERIKAGGPTSG